MRTNSEGVIMKITIIGTVLATTLLATTAFAGDATVEDKYKTIEKKVPHTENICNTVDIPIYGNVGGGASGTDVLGGMIIGGLLGKGITGKDNGAAAGAVLGGIFQADKKQNKQNQIVGYRQQQQCYQNTTYTIERNTVYSHSIVTFSHEGKQHRVKFNRY